MFHHTIIYLFIFFYLKQLNGHGGGVWLWYRSQVPKHIRRPRALTDRQSHSHTQHTRTTLTSVQRNRHVHQTWQLTIESPRDVILNTSINNTTNKQLTPRRIQIHSRYPINFVTCLRSVPGYIGPIRSTCVCYKLSISTLTFTLSHQLQPTSHIFDSTKVILPPLN